MTGVPFSELRCPTCGEPFGSTAVYDEPDANRFDVDVKVPRRDLILPRRPYLTCKAGHRWTIKSLIRYENRPDEVLLDKFIGESSS